MIETQGLRKQFGPTVAVSDLSLHVAAGETFGFLGPNGAGKTTSIKMLLALVEPTAGTGRVLGAPLGDRAARARIGFPSIAAFTRRSRRPSCCGFTAASMGCEAPRWRPASIDC
jgi:ABC-type uncharacterized transport system ATPase subunit